MQVMLNAVATILLTGAVLAVLHGVGLAVGGWPRRG
jgi:hypothetical protein